MTAAIVLCSMVFVLAAGCGLCLAFSNTNRLLIVPVVSSAIAAVLSVFAAVRFFSCGPISLFGDFFRIDALSLYHIFLVNAVFLIASIYATGYFGRESASMLPRSMRRYAMLWQAFQAILLLVLLSNNIGIMWVSLEATTLVSAFLILSDSDPLSLEAMWKYLLVCSVGIVFAFMGTLITMAATKGFPAGKPVFLFTGLAANAHLLSPKLMLIAFIFVVVGFGTKAGLAPMHTWLPDAHSQAPTPVSAVFSGVMLNCALYCIMRYLPITESALGFDGQAHRILLLFGVISLIFAAVFIPIQRDMKRLLAYCSVEHLGIIALGLGIGGLGTFAALLHTLNHSLSKVIAFFSAGRIGQQYETRDMSKISGAASRLPLWGAAFFVSILVLIGVAPFSVFMSEFLIVKEAFVKGRYFTVRLFLFCALVIFISILRQVMAVSFGKESGSGTPEKRRFADFAIVAGCFAVLLLLGVWIPAPFSGFLKSAALIVEQGSLP